MPRDGSSIYHRPPGTDGIPNTTIASTPYNAYVADIEQDLNTPRPIVAGGTGANNAHDAMIALSGEITGQQVTNYDSFPFVSGTFFSNPGATSAPDAIHYFVGICYMQGGLVVLEARLFSGSATGNVKFVRVKDGSGWHPWEQQPGSQADNDAAYVNVGGDTMTGPLTLAAGSPALILNGAASGANNQLLGYVTGKSRWLVRLGNGSAEGGGNTGSEFDISRFDDAGNYVGTPFNIMRATGNATFSQALNVGAAMTAATVWSVSGPTTGTFYFGSSGTKYLNYDGTNFNLNGGQLNISHQNLLLGASGSVASLYFGGTGTKVLSFDGSVFNLTGGQLNAAAITAGGAITASGGITAIAHLMAQNGVVYFNAAATAYLALSGGSYSLVGGANFSVLSGGNMVSQGHIASDLGYLGQAGVSGGRSGNRFNIEYVSSPHLWINGSDLGQIAFVSDYRVKKDVVDLDSMWDTVKGLRPIKYTQAEFTPPVEKQKNAALMLKAKEDGGEYVPPPTPLVPADDIERWGFIAHELQETLTQSAASGVKDSPNEIQSPNPFTIIAALTKTLQEAQTRIEALEARVATLPA